MAIRLLARAVFTYLRGVSVRISRQLANLAIWSWMLLLSEFLQPLVNASKFFSYTGLLSNEAPILFVEAAQFFR